MSRAYAYALGMLKYVMLFLHAYACHVIDAENTCHAVDEVWTPVKLMLI